jgi:hypothetical protein
MQICNDMMRLAVFYWAQDRLLCKITVVERLGQAKLTDENEGRNGKSRLRWPAFICSRGATTIRAAP